MGKMKDFVDDFLYIVNEAEEETYEHKDWSWDKLPPIEIMFEIVNRYNEKNNKTEDSK
jgi:hypothetical protein